MDSVSVQNKLSFQYPSFKISIQATEVRNDAIYLLGRLHGTLTERQHTRG